MGSEEEGTEEEKGDCRACRYQIHCPQTKGTLLMVIKSYWCGSTAVGTLDENSESHIKYIRISLDYTKFWPLFFGYFFVIARESCLWDSSVVLILLQLCYNILVLCCFARQMTCFHICPNVIPYTISLIPPGKAHPSWWNNVCSI